MDEKGLTGLRCPYTGAPMTLQFDSDLSRAGFHFEGGLDPAVPFMSKDQLRAAMAMRNGVVPAKAKRKSLTCAYTGNKLSLREAGGLFYLDGIYFSPARRTMDKAAIIFAANTRDGVEPEGLPRSEVRVRVSTKELGDPGPALGLEGLGQSETEAMVDLVLNKG